MLRALRITLLILLLGCVINVSIALVAALWSSANLVDSRTKSLLDTMEWIRRQRPDGVKFPHTLDPDILGLSETQWRRAYQLRWWFRSQSAFALICEVRELDLQRLSKTASPGPSISCLEIRAGWPASALKGQYWEIDQGHASVYPLVSMARTAPMFIPFADAPYAKNPLRVQPTQRLIPLHPLLPGFLINTLFYSSLLYFLFFFPLSLRRRLRIRRGLCPRCAYDLHSSKLNHANCPECGHALVANNSR